MKSKDKEEYVKQLQKWVDAGGRFVVCVESVSRSGMARKLSVRIVLNSELLWVTYMAAEITGRTRDKDGHIIMRGCGYDTRYELIDDIAKTIGRPESIQRYYTI